MKKRRRNPVNWERQAHWFEGEGGKTKPPSKGVKVQPIQTVMQDIARIDIVDKLCSELIQAGFTPTRYRVGRTERCEIGTVEQQKCFINRTKRYYLSQQTREWAEEYLKEIERRKPRTPRKPFKCPK